METDIILNRDTLHNHRLLLEASNRLFLISTKQLAELTDISEGTANSKPSYWSKYGFIFKKHKLEEGSGVVWSVRQLILEEQA